MKFDDQQYCVESDIEHEYPRRTEQQSKNVQDEVMILRLLHFGNLQSPTVADKFDSPRETSAGDEKRSSLLMAEHSANSQNYAVGDQLATFANGGLMAVYMDEGEEKNNAGGKFSTTKHSHVAPSPDVDTQRSVITQDLNVIQQAHKDGPVSKNVNLFNTKISSNAYESSARENH